MTNIVNLAEYRRQLAIAAWREWTAMFEIEGPLDELLANYHLTIYPRLYFGPAIAPFLDAPLTAKQSPSLRAQPEDVEGDPL